MKSMNSLNDPFCKEEAKILLDDFWRNLDVEKCDNMYAWAYSISAKTRQVISRNICHASFSKITNPWYISSQAFEKSDNSHYFHEAWDWIMGENSPWRLVTNNGKAVSKVYDSKGKIAGWCLEGDYLDSVPANLLKNFVIATRQFNERVYSFSFWKRLLDVGFDPTDAFFLCTFFSYSKGIISFENNYLAQGAHWPITCEYISNVTLKFLKFDLNKFRYSNYNSSAFGVNKGWCSEKNKSKACSVLDELVHICQRKRPNQLALRHKLTKFTCMNYLDEDDLFSLLKEYIDKYNSALLEDAAKELNKGLNNA